MARRTKTAEISYRERKREQVVFAYTKEGTREEIEESAQHLLASLRDEGLRGAVVYIDGRKIRRRKMEV